MTVIQNTTTGAVIADRATSATNAWTRFRGLMLHGRLEQGEALIIRPCSSIHMMFMRFPIDAVFFDKEERVTKVAHNVRPWWGLAFGGRGAKCVIELPRDAGNGIEPGHQLLFRD